MEIPPRSIRGPALLIHYVFWPECTLLALTLMTQGREREWESYLRINLFYAGKDEVPLSLPCSS